MDIYYNVNISALYNQWLTLDPFSGGVQTDSNMVKNAKKVYIVLKIHLMLVDTFLDWYKIVITFLQKLFVA